MSALQARRYTYGKAVLEPGGAVLPGFEHQVTRQGQGLSSRLLEFCHPLDLIGRTSTIELVHPDAHASGAMFLWPVRWDGSDYMILGRVRPRPEAGEGKPGRTYTQLNTAVIAGADWCAHAPEILAAAPDWLRADPDLETDLDPKDAPDLDLPVPDGPLCPDSDPLPGLDDWPWVLLRGLEDRSRPTLVGSDAGLPDEGAFCRALGQALALLPPPLRILVTACTGFAAPRPEFAIQFIPEARPETPDRTLGYFGQLAQGHHCATFADWRRLGRDEFSGLDASVAGATWSSPAQAREGATRLIGSLSRGLVIDYLRRFLAGEMPRCPVLPTGPDAADLQPRVVALVADTLHQGLAAGEPTQSLARAAEVVAGLNGPEWTRAWIAATKAADPSLRSDLLLWAALRSDPGHDAPLDWVGVIWSFTALGRIRRLTALIADYHRAAGLTDPRVLRHAGLAARVERLLAQAPNLIRDHPAELLPLAKTLPDAFSKHPAREAVLARLKELIPVLGLLALAPGAKANDHRALYEAAGSILAASYGTPLPPPDETRDRWCRQAAGLRLVCFDYCLQTAIAENPEAASFWAQALACTLLAGSDVRDAVAALLGQVRDHPAISVQKAGDRLDAPFAEVFQGFAATATDPGALASGILDALAEQGPQLAAEPGTNRLRLALARALKPTLFKAIGECGQNGLGQIIPVGTKLLAGAATRFGESSGFFEFYCDLGAKILERMLRLGNRDRKAAIGIFMPLETLMYRNPEMAWAIPRSPGDPGDLDDPSTWEIAEASTPLRTPVVAVTGSAAGTEAGRRYQKRVRALAKILRDLILSWVKSEPPEPWFLEVPGKALADCPIRLNLARALGFPRCLYFGRLTDSTEGGVDERQVIDQGAAKVRGGRGRRLTIAAASSDERRVMALCGVRLWRALYETKMPLHRGRITTLLKDDGAGEALDGLAELVAEGERRMLDALGEDMVFLADFFRLGGPQPRADSTPPEIRKVLLGTAIEADVQASCLPLFLGRGILTEGAVALAIGSGFLRALTESGGITGRIFGGHGEFERLKDEAVAARLDRILFGLNLLYVQPLQGSPKYARAPVPDEQFGAFALTPGQQAHIEALFKARPEYRHAFERAITLAAHPQLPGWPKT